MGDQHPLPAAGLHASNEERSWPSWFWVLPGMSSGRIQGMCPGRSAKAPESNKNEQDWFSGIWTLLPCHQKIYVNSPDKTWGAR